MAGSFGYQLEHCDLSKQAAKLIPAVCAAPTDNLIAAPGTGCRHETKIARDESDNIPQRFNAMHWSSPRLV
jgi:hypothetical protein